MVSIFDFCIFDIAPAQSGLWQLWTSLGTVYIFKLLIDPTWVIHLSLGSFRLLASVHRVILKFRYIWIRKLNTPKLEHGPIVGWLLNQGVFRCVELWLVAHSALTHVWRNKALLCIATDSRYLIRILTCFCQFHLMQALCGHFSGSVALFEGRFGRRHSLKRVVSECWGCPVCGSRFVARRVEFELWNLIPLGLRDLFHLL